MNPEPALLKRFDQALALIAQRSVRANAARPPPPPQLTVHAMPEFRLILALEGVKEEVFGEGESIAHWRMEPGDVLLVRPDTWLSPLFHTRHRHLGIILAVDRARVMWSRCDGNAKAPQPLTIEVVIEVPVPEHSALRQVADALLAVDIRNEYEAARHLVASFLHLLRAAATLPQEAATKGERTWRQTVGYLHDNCHRTIGREEAARALDMSPNYLSRVCRERSGRSFIDLITELRLERAAGMLRAVDLPVAAVARACGFADAGYFIRRFRRGFGATPGAYRRTQRAS